MADSWFLELIHSSLTLLPIYSAFLPAFCLSLTPSHFTCCSVCFNRSDLTHQCVQGSSGSTSTPAVPLSECCRSTKRRLVLPALKINRIGLWVSVYCCCCAGHPYVAHLWASANAGCNLPCSHSTCSWCCNHYTMVKPHTHGGRGVVGGERREAKNKCHWPAPWPCAHCQWSPPWQAALSATPQPPSGCHSRGMTLPIWAA